ncbi:hypothetical protein GPECTOR_2g1122 [Gonium pectorale]|uniref:Uncharacterized protein n=1 Tax=Gonium pectorale TaxID=33097 RepID=A0A150H0P0_GONPE|nr:hypothetical protein GPECTOR_2g1122 [Gonium pectorale]|eukprot:KXZ55573.1 hypothetical protein GPECTOR_2g1122 [Gonium pectorale]
MRLLSVKGSGRQLPGVGALSALQLLCLPISSHTLGPELQPPAGAAVNVEGAAACGGPPRARTALATEGGLAAGGVQRPCGPVAPDRRDLAHVDGTYSVQEREEEGVKEWKGERAGPRCGALKVHFAAPLLLLPAAAAAELEAAWAGLRADAAAAARGSIGVDLDASGSATSSSSAAAAAAAEADDEGAAAAAAVAEAEAAVWREAFQPLLEDVAFLAEPLPMNGLVMVPAGEEDEEIGSRGSGGEPAAATAAVARLAGALLRFLETAGMRATADAVRLAVGGGSIDGKRDGCGGCGDILTRGRPGGVEAMGVAEVQDAVPNAAPQGRVDEEAEAEEVPPRGGATHEGPTSGAPAPPVDITCDTRRRPAAPAAAAVTPAATGHTDSASPDGGVGRRERAFAAWRAAWLLRAVPYVLCLSVQPYFLTAVRALAERHPAAGGQLALVLLQWASDCCGLLLTLTLTLAWVHWRRRRHHHHRCRGSSWSVLSPLEYGGGSAFESAAAAASAATDVPSLFSARPTAAAGASDGDAKAVRHDQPPHSGLYDMYEMCNAQLSALLYATGFLALRCGLSSASASTCASGL